MTSIIIIIFCYYSLAIGLQSLFFSLFGDNIYVERIYSLLTFNGQYKSISNLYPEGTIVSSGLSKWCGAGGWRLGFFAIPNHIKLYCIVGSTITRQL